ncbi:hypothetical protein BBJ28_00002541 [Nothophytophthora sp. Chile5]|nr:hypothetical protein BBJ28_00002541 [Nothophytophthora sp. Chile5]
MPTTADTCLYGSVVGLDKLLALDSGGNQAEERSPSLAPSECDECEQQSASVACEDCGLVYCSPCDAHRHRKGKLQAHQRTAIVLVSAIAEESGSAIASVIDWSVHDVCEWLEAHDLLLFVEEARTQTLDGAGLLSSERLDRFLELSTGVSRGQKKKLQREVHKLQSTTLKPEQEETSSSNRRELKTPPAPSPPPPRQTGSNSMRRIGLDLRVDVQPPVAMRAAPRRAKSSLPLGVNQLKIDVGEASSTPKRSNGGIRQASGALNLDLSQVKREEKAVAASFDFSATGRLHTQGFEINTRGIKNVPFHSRQQQRQTGEKQSASDSATETLGTRESLLLLEELGHGAGGKVFKALYMPTFRLVAVKVIRVYDQQKRHQMVRELKSLYVNFVPLAAATFPSASASSTVQAACEELVVFYDAYTNPEVGSVSIVLEYMDGGSLEDHMQATSGEAGCSSEKEIANVAVCGLKGLAFLHEHHQLHRDIKLSNMLINHQGQVKVVSNVSLHSCPWWDHFLSESCVFWLQISDFGISRDLESTLAKATTFTGTLLYMAPERISGGMYSYPSDIWSFGLAVMACAIGKLPVPAKDGYWGVVHAVQEQPSPRLSDFGDRFSPELCDFLDQCLQKNPMLRPPAARLLEHPFIRKNHSPREQESARLHLEQQPPTEKALERSRQELLNIATKAHSWCQEHVDALRQRSPSTTQGDQPRERFDHISSRSKIEALAAQLRLPVDEVAPHLSFLAQYCD